MKQVLLFYFLFFMGIVAQAQPGSLDSSFGTNGLSENDWGNDETIFGSAVQPDGKIIFVGSSVITVGNEQGANSCALARYNYNGTPDSSFGTNGLVRIRVDKSGKTNFFSVAVQEDGKLLVAGIIYTDYPYEHHSVIFRCTKEGVVDPSFGDKGFVQTSDGFLNNTLGDLTLQPDGKILAAGSIEQIVSGITQSSMLIVRLNKNGKRDSSFGKNGRQIISINAYSAASGLQLLPNGKILVGGVAYLPTRYVQNFAAIRLTASGRLDSSFGSGGKVITPIADYSYAADIIITGTGKFVLGGSAITGDEGDFALVRYEANGTVDSSFGNNGIATTNFGMYDDITQLALQPDGKIVAFGINESADSRNYKARFALARYKANGQLDADFGAGGRVLTDFGNKISQAWTGFIQTNGRIVAAGITASPGNNNDFAVAGYQSGLSLQQEQKTLPIAKLSK